MSRQKGGIFISSEYGKTVKKILIDKDKTQTWLAEQVSISTGLKVDRKYMNKILKGLRTPPRVISAINEILELPPS